MEHLILRSLYISTMKYLAFLFQNGDNLLHVAVHNNNIELVNLILDRTKLDPAKQNKVRSVLFVRKANCCHFFLI